VARVRVLVIGRKPPRYLTDLGRAVPVDRGRWRLSPGALALGVVTARGGVRITEQIFSPPAQWDWARQAGPLLRFLSFLPPEAGPEILDFLWEQWAGLRETRDFGSLWVKMLATLGHPLPPCVGCGGNMEAGGDPERWICPSCGGKGSPDAVLSAHLRREFGVELFQSLDHS